MFKLLLVCVAIGFAAAQFVTLRCPTCLSPAECVNPEYKLCNNSSADATTLALSKYYIIPSINNVGSNFSCISDIYQFINSTVDIVTKGCEYTELNVCNFKLKQEYKNMTGQYVHICQRQWINNQTSNGTGNGNSTGPGQGGPAGTYSSSHFTIVASILVVMIAKICS